MNWLITGGCGFLGTSLIARLTQSEGENIRVIDNLSVGTRDDLSRVCEFTEIAVNDVDASFDGVQLVVADIVDEDDAVKATQGADVIIHLAANTGVGPSVEDPRKDCILNVVGTLNYLEAARANDIKRFVLASSGAPVGEVEPPIHEELAAHPVSPYGASKLAGEGYCSAYYQSFKIDTVALRFGNVYGPGSIHKDSVVAKFIKKAFSGERLEVYGSGKQTRDFIYIDDLLDAMVNAATLDGIGGEIFQIATSAETTVDEMAAILLDVLKQQGLNDIEMFNSEARLGDVMRNFSDTSKADRMMGWQAKVKLPEGLQKTVEYFVTLNGE